MIRSLAVRPIALVLATAFALAGNAEAGARGCMVHDHQPLQVRRMPITPETTSKPRNPLEDEAVHCEETKRQGLPTLGMPGGPRTEEAPFGLSWGPLTNVPKPSMVDREGNITALIYLHDHPPAGGSDTDRVILEVCKDEGLQQVIWLSRPLSEGELPTRYRAIHREGVRRYGRPEKVDGSGSVVWPSGRAVLSIRKAVLGEQRLVMVSRGDRYAACSHSHQAATGHPAGVHASTLLDRGGDKP